MRARDELPPYGTVPYHQHYIRSSRRNRNIQLTLAATQLLLLTVLGDIWWQRLMNSLVLVFSACSAQNAHNSLSEHRMQAWHVETLHTLQGMAEAGIFNMTEAIHAMRDGPRPPGVSAKQWQRRHQELLDSLP